MPKKTSSRSPRRVKKQPINPMFTVRPAYIKADRAISILRPLVDGHLLNAEPWSTVFGVEPQLFLDYEHVWNEYTAVMRGIPDEMHDRLEHVLWALEQRRMQAAYMLGVVVGAMRQGGAR